MPKFTIVNAKGRKVKDVQASGNLEALCIFFQFKGNGLPNIPMHTYQGILLADIFGRIFAVFDSRDNPDLTFLQGNLTSKVRLSGVSRQNLVSTVKRLLSAQTAQVMETAHVV